VDTVQTLDIASIAVSTVALFYASWSDLKTREVSNSVWTVYAPIALIISVVRWVALPSLLAVSLVSIGLTAFVSILLFYLGLYGGADAKALICIGLASPVFPSAVDYAMPPIHPILPLAVLYNGYLFSLAAVFYALAKNAGRKMGGGSLFTGFEEEKLTTRLMMVLTGYKARFGEARASVSLIPIEIPGETGGRSIRLFTNAEEDRDRLIEELKFSGVVDGDEVWVTPGLPMLVFFFFAYIVSVTVGDVMARGIFRLLSILF